METKAKKSPKLFLIAGGVVAGLCVLATVIMLAVGGGTGKKLSEQLDLGEKYLSELNYESAITAYEAAIKIDPKAEDAYIGLAEVYVAMGEPEKALEVLQTGYEETSSDVIKEREEEIRQEQEAENAGGDSSEIESEVVADGTEEADKVDAGTTETETVEETETAATEEPVQRAPEVTFIPWEEAGLEDFVIDWKSGTLENAVRQQIGITDRDIMLSDVWEVQMLDFSDMLISDISALSNMKNLTQLYLYRNRVTDISALSELTNLQRLALYGNQISDISALKGLTNLTMLDLGNTGISDVSALSGLTNLTDLRMAENNIDDISALGELTNLTALDLQNNNISDVSALSGLTNLTYLSLWENNINDISALSELKNLENLVLWGNPIEDYSPVSFVPELYHD